MLTIYVVIGILVYLTFGALITWFMEGEVFVNPLINLSAPILIIPVAITATVDYIKHYKKQKIHRYETDIKYRRKIKLNKVLKRKWWYV